MAEVEMAHGLFSAGFKGINIERWIDNAHNAMSFTVAGDTIEKYFLAVDNFENNCVLYTDKHPEYEIAVNKEIARLETDRKLSQTQKDAKIASFKLKNLIRLIDLHQIKKKTFIIDFEKFRELEAERKAAKKVIADGGEPEPTTAV